jgi:hypothetical protein
VFNYMNLTIVLVTQPSRVNFLHGAISRVHQLLLECEWISVLFILNGTSPALEDQVQTIKENFLERVKIERNEHNLSMPHNYLHFVKKNNLDWVIFPGDDDLLVVSSFSLLPQFLSDRSLSAIALSAACIDENDKPTGKTLHPTFLDQDSVVQQLMKATEKPPFVWPALVFRASVLKDEIFSSLFVVDWWISLSLILKTGVRTLPDVIICYRIHENQVSKAAFENRKRFEGQIMILDFLARNSVQIRFLAQQNHEEAAKLMHNLLPIYGDDFFGPLIRIVMSAIVEVQLNASPVELARLARSLGPPLGVFMPSLEFPLHRPLLPGAQNQKLNFSFELLEGTCRELVNRIFLWSDDFGHPAVSVGCNHSVQSPGKQIIILPCDAEALSLPNDKFVTEFLRKITLTLPSRSNGGLELTLFENRVFRILRQMIRMIRKFRSIFVRLS